MTRPVTTRRVTLGFRPAAILAAAAAAAGLAAAAPALAHGSVHFGVGIGLPLYAPPPVYYGPPAYYYAPPPVVVAPPVQYVTPPAPAEAPPSSVWYYCDNPRGYYPYVPECSTAWREVPATPQGR